MTDPLIEVIGTILVIQPAVPDVSGQQYSQKIILSNAMAVNNPINLPDRLLIMVKSISIIPFRINDPITVKGFYSHQPSELSYMYGVRAPQGYMRYNGKVYR